MSLDLGVNKSPQNVGCDWQVDEDELGLLMKAEEGEVVAQLHCLDGVLLLLTRRNKNVNVSTVRSQTEGRKSEYLQLRRTVFKYIDMFQNHNNHEELRSHASASRATTETSRWQIPLNVYSGVRGCKTLAN